MSPANDDLEVQGDLVIPAKYFEFLFSHSSGPGGQNVNKTASRAEIRLDLDAVLRDGVMPSDVGQRLRNAVAVASHRRVRVVRQSSRDRLVNIEQARQAVAELIRAALTAPKPRKATRPTKSAKAKRVDEKKKHGQTKSLRKRPDWE
jgi:ribosome-associated protein